MNDDLETLVNIHGETITIKTNDDGTATTTTESGAQKTFPTREKAITAVYKMGYIF